MNEASGYKLLLKEKLKDSNFKGLAKLGNKFPETPVACACFPMFSNLATREALFPESILFPRSKIYLYYTAKRGDNLKNMFLETCFLVLPGV